MTSAQVGDQLPRRAEDQIDDLVIGEEAAGEPEGYRLRRVALPELERKLERFLLK